MIASDALLAERVERGALFLDEVDPGWERRIDVGALDLQSCSTCVLGQLFGSFSDGLDRLDLSLTVSRVLGLNYEYQPAGWQGPLPGSHEAERDEADRLRKLWLTEIDNRQEA